MVKTGVGWFGLLGVILISISSVHGQECPKMPGALGLELHKEFPQYRIIIADAPAVQEEERTGSGPGKRCARILQLGPDEYVILLKGKEAESSLLVDARFIRQVNDEGWTLQEVERFRTAGPQLEPAGAGFYADVDSGRKLTVTRNSKAFQVLLPSSGTVYIYKRDQDDSFAKCRLR